MSPIVTQCGVVLALEGKGATLRDRRCIVATFCVAVGEATLRGTLATSALRVV